MQLVREGQLGNEYRHGEAYATEQTYTYDLSFAAGERRLVRDPSGTGKSTRLLATAGLWPFGRDRIRLPSGAPLMFMPQNNYLPDGLLKEALTYPLAVETVDHEQCRHVLIECRRPQFADRLGESVPRGQRLSPGEQQRLAFVHALLYRLDVLCIEEARSAMDNETEALQYKLLLEHLRQRTIVSDVHQAALEAFHDL